MDAACFQISETATGKMLLNLDYEKWESRLVPMDRTEKLQFLEAPATTHSPQAVSSTDSSSSNASAHSKAITYDDTLLFITAAQEAAYGFFGKLMEKPASSKGELDSEELADAGEGGSEAGDLRRVGESIPVSEWSQEGDVPLPKKSRMA